MPQETNTKRGIRARLERGGAKVVKLNPSNGNGEPDFLACYRGLTLALEHKPPGPDRTKPARRRLQQHRLDQWEQAGAIARVVRTGADVDAVLAEADRILAQGRPTPTGGP